MFCIRILSCLVLSIDILILYIYIHNQVNYLHDFNPNINLEMFFFSRNELLSVFKSKQVSYFIYCDLNWYTSISTNFSTVLVKALDSNCFQIDIFYSSMAVSWPEVVFDNVFDLNFFICILIIINCLLISALFFFIQPPIIIIL